MAARGVRVERGANRAADSRIRRIVHDRRRSPRSPRLASPRSPSSAAPTTTPAARSASRRSTPRRRPPRPRSPRTSEEAAAATSRRPRRTGRRRRGQVRHRDHQGRRQLHRQGARDEGARRSARTPSSARPRRSSTTPSSSTAASSQDVLVRIANDGVKGDYKAPTSTPRSSRRTACTRPASRASSPGQDIDIKNGDGTLHNVHTYKGAESWFNQAQPKGSDAHQEGARGPERRQVHLRRAPVDARLRRRHRPPVLRRAAARTARSRSRRSPPASTTSRPGTRTTASRRPRSKVEDGKTAEVKFTYDGTEAEPAENKDELKGLW